MRNRRILMASFGAPYQWGGATFFYELSEMLRLVGVDVCHLVLATSVEAGAAEAELGPEWFDPLHRGSRCIVATGIDAMLRELQSAVIDFSPDLLCSKEARGTILLRQCGINVPLFYLRSGDDAARAAASVGFEAAEILSELEKTGAVGEGFRTSFEDEALAAADTIIPQSTLIKRLLAVRFPEHLPKVTEVVWTCYLMKPPPSALIPFPARTTDILFAASDWSDPAKNAAWVENISLSLADELRIVIAGASSNFKRYPRIRYTGTISRAEVGICLANSKLLVVPSLFDAAPNVVTEALYSGCNVLVSQNCGQSELLHEQILPLGREAHDSIQQLRQCVAKEKPTPIHFRAEEILAKLCGILWKDKDRA